MPLPGGGRRDIQECRDFAVSEVLEIPHQQHLAILSREPREHTADFVGSLSAVQAVART